MKLTKRLLTVALLAALTLPVLGCAGVGSTPAENRRAIARIVDYDTRMLYDDWALITLSRTTLKTSRWVID
jgi:hypothetical protein